MKTWIVAATALIAASSQAQMSAPDIWRCGPQGRTYADSPCQDGRVVAVADRRSATAVQDARAVAAREQRLAERMVREREQQERLGHRSGAGKPGPLTAKAVKPPAVQRRALRRTPPADGIWRAVVPASPRARG